MLATFASLQFSENVKASEPPSTEWNQNYGSYYTDEVAYSIVQTSDGGYALAGDIYSYPYPPTGYHAYLVKTDSSGNMQWNMTYGGSGENHVRSVVQTIDGGYALAGYTNSYSSDGYFDIWLMKTDSAGNLEWSKTYGSIGVQDYATSLIQTIDGGYALSCYSTPTVSNPNSIIFLKTDSAGNTIFMLNPSETYRANSILQMSDGEYVLLGTTQFGTNIWRLYSTYGIRGAYGPNDPSELNAYAIVQTSDGGFAFVGDKTSLHVGNDIYLVKTGSLLSKYDLIQWNSTFGGDYDDSCRSLVQTSDGGYALVGRTKSYGAGNWDFYLIKTDSSAALDWQKTFGGAFDDGAYCVIKTSDGGLALAGYSYSNTNGGSDMWLVKLSPLEASPNPTPSPTTYTATIWAWDALDSNGWIAEPITMDGVSTGFSTPHTFTGLSGVHTFTVPTTDVDGRTFNCWDTGETSTTITVNSDGTHTAQYASYYATIWAWNILGWIAEPITMDGVSTGFSTPHTFTGLTGTHTFTVPDTDAYGYAFSDWDTGETTTTLSVTSDGTHTARYGLTPTPTPTTTPTPTPTLTPTPNPTTTPTPTSTPAPSTTPTPSPTPNQTPDPTPTPTSSTSPTPTSTITVSPTPTENPTPTPTHSTSTSSTPNPTTTQPASTNTASTTSTSTPTPNPTSTLLATPTSNPSPSQSLSPSSTPFVEPMPTPLYILIIVIVILALMLFLAFIMRRKRRQA